MTGTQTEQTNAMETGTQKNLTTTTEAGVQAEATNNIETSTQTEQKVLEEKGIQTEGVPAYAHLVDIVAKQRLQNELVQLRHELTQYRKEVVPLREYQALQKKFTDLSLTEDETFSQLRGE